MAVGQIRYPKWNPVNGHMDQTQPCGPLVLILTHTHISRGRKFSHGGCPKTHQPPVLSSQGLGKGPLERRPPDFGRFKRPIDGKRVELVYLAIRFLFFLALVEVEWGFHETTKSQS